MGEERVEEIKRSVRLQMIVQYSQKTEADGKMRTGKGKESRKMIKGGIVKEESVSVSFFSFFFFPVHLISFII